MVKNGTEKELKFVNIYFLGVNIMKKIKALESWEVEQINYFKKSVEKTRGNCVIVHIDVAKSGMSRKLKFMFADKEQNFRNIYHILELAGFKPNDYGQITVKGCGMDMVWATLMTIYEFCGIGNDDANAWASHYATI